MINNSIFCNIPLNNRLKLVASFVRQDCKMVDVGTDHGYLPIWLLKTNRVKSAIACDINRLPLEKAKENIDKYFAENIKTVLSDGLENISADEVDDITIAGMGGELIAHIIDNAKSFQVENKHFILQPMSSVEELFCYLKDNNYKITQQDAIVDKGKLYTVFVAIKSQQLVEYSKLFEYIGNINPKANDYCTQFVKKQIVRAENKLKGYLHNNDTNKIDELQNIIKLLNKEIE